MQIIYKKPDELKPYENNPRINDDAVQYVKESIRQFGFKNPVIIDKNNVIVCGHTRLLAAQELKLATVPCIIADDLTDEEIKGFRLADNKVAEFSRWDFDKLEVELDDLEIDMSDFGFDDINIDEYGTDFSLNDGDKSEFCEMNFIFHEKQKELIEYALSICGDSVHETFGNSNKNGNSLYELVRQWAEQRN